MPKGYNVFSTFNPEQKQLFAQLIQALSGQNLATSQAPTFQAGQDFLSKLLGGDTESFEAPLMRQFQEQIIPGIAERFSGLGAGAQRSSAFQQALSQSGADLAERLGSLRGQLGLSALGPALSYAQAPSAQLSDILGLNTQALAPKQMGFGKQLALGLAGGVGSALGSAIPGLNIGQGLGKLGSSFSNLFSNLRGEVKDIAALRKWVG